MSKRSVTRPLWILLLLFSWSGLVLGATTGKIAGTVKDAESGEGLPGANVVLEGTTMGAASNIDGDYFIINIPPGEYAVRVTMMGYAPVVVENVVVRIDRTTTVDLELKAQVLDVGGEVTVTAEREVVRMDVSFTQTNLSA